MTTNISGETTLERSFITSGEIGSFVFFLPFSFFLSFFSVRQFQGYTTSRETVFHQENVRTRDEQDEQDEQ